ncbi:uncharacterized protein LAESUDRAFT_3397 [Laetiporus sulphureus 93-53]|uniref:Uncharacterized protein n=1 Tax=Laetiporus sulphureus 93-53 TaxID=1314785 RepID=A0A165I300_9APHY|nr:uncharacterized protein LAESUDRAFT_3397 [Laetiporus sulphureus 93-53]KZT12524.1 hypothetical protein LAESUDRAFT_3397 [Laetiporus sulphureus 93-53]
MRRFSNHAESVSALHISSTSAATTSVSRSGPPTCLATETYFLCSWSVASSRKMNRRRLRQNVKNIEAMKGVTTVEPAGWLEGAHTSVFRAGKHVEMDIARVGIEDCDDDIQPCTSTREAGDTHGVVAPIPHLEEFEVLPVPLGSDPADDVGHVHRDHAVRHGRGAEHAPSQAEPPDRRAERRQCHERLDFDLGVEPVEIDAQVDEGPRGRGSGEEREEERRGAVKRAHVWRDLVWEGDVPIRLACAYGLHGLRRRRGRAELDDLRLTLEKVEHIFGGEGEVGGETGEGEGGVSQDPAVRLARGEAEEREVGEICELCEGLCEELQACLRWPHVLEVDGELAHMPRYLMNARRSDGPAEGEDSDTTSGDFAGVQEARLGASPGRDATGGRWC